MTYDQKAVAGRLRNRRKELGMTLADVAAKIGRMPNHYGNIERGVCGMSVETLILLSDCLGLTCDYILHGNKEDTEQQDLETACRFLMHYDEKTQDNAVKLMKYYLELAEGEE